MIQANELRIGNLISANGLHGGNELTVEEIGSRGTLSDDMRVIKFKEHHVGEFVKDCNPIQLTEEILNRFGFEHYNNSYYKIRLRVHNGGSAEIYISAEHGIYCIDGGISKYRCQYVHQLQNLCFALTGEDLVLK